MPLQCEENTVKHFYTSHFLECEGGLGGYAYGLIVFSFVSIVLAPQMDSLLSEWLLYHISSPFWLLKALFSPFTLVKVCAETASHCATGQVLLFFSTKCSMFLCRCCYRSCSRNPIESILARVKKLGQTFKEHYSLDSEDMPGSHIGTNTNGCSPTHSLKTTVG